MTLRERVKNARKGVRKSLKRGHKVGVGSYKILNRIIEGYGKSRSKKRML